jgi:phage gpG-like protein
MADEINPNVQIHGAQLKAVISLQKQLDNPQALMKKLGAMVLGASVDSFKKQALGEFKWKPRYPGQSEPKLNIAGAISDFQNGRFAPKPIRFVDRPALIDEGFRGGLAGSMTYKALDQTSFQVGTNKPYAPKQFYGGVSRQPITNTVKDGIRKFLYKKGDKKKGYTKKGEPYAPKLEPLLRKKVYSIMVGSRPFVGIFSELWHDILNAVQEHFEKYTGKR